MIHLKKIILILIILFINTGWSQTRPNIFFAIADDWGPSAHSSIMGDKVVKTPTFDRIANEGILFTKAYVTVASCTPSRASTLAGQMFWRLGSASNLVGRIPNDTPLYTDILRDAGYAVGSSRKGCAPGCGTNGEFPAAGKSWDNLESFLDSVPQGQPFCFWQGTSDPHRGYSSGSGANSGMNLNDVELPPFWPDVNQIRSDVADYYWEVQRFDGLVGNGLKLLEDRGLLENTIVIMTSDHAMPFPRFKSNSYEFSNNVPFAVRWGDSVSSGRRVNDFISFQDLAPTFLEAAGVEIPDVMTGNSFLDVIKSDGQGRVDPGRDHIFFGKNKHTANYSPVINALKDNGLPIFYAPQRTILTGNYILVWNMAPDDWPMGPAPWYPDVDNALQTGGGQTKGYMLDHRDDPEVKDMFEMSFLKRTEYELYDMINDPWHMQNLADDPAHSDSLLQLKGRLERYLCDTEDPEALVDTLGNLDCDTVWKEVSIYQDRDIQNKVLFRNNKLVVNLTNRYEIHLLDIKGRVLKSLRNSRPSKFDLPELKSGIYLLQIEANNKKSYRTYFLGNRL